MFPHEMFFNHIIDVTPAYLYQTFAHRRHYHLKQSNKPYSGYVRRGAKFSRRPLALNY